MWGFFNCTHYLHRFGQTSVVLKDASLAAEDEDKIAIFIPPGRGKTTIVRLLTGVDRPVAGDILRPQGAWPLGYAGGFRPEMTGESNTRVLARFAGVDPDELSAFVYEFSDLGDAYFLPLAYYTNRMKSRLGLAASLGIPTRIAIADDKLIGGDPEFREKGEAALRQRLDSTGLIFLTSNPRPAEDICDRFVILDRGQFEEYDSYLEASEKLNEILNDQAVIPAEPEDDAIEPERENNAMLYFDLA